MMGMQFEFFRDDFFQPVFDFTRVLSGRKAGPVGHAKNMRIDRDDRPTESHVQNDICRFTSNTGQLFEFVPVLRYLSTVVFDQRL